MRNARLRVAEVVALLGALALAGAGVAEETQTIHALSYGSNAAARLQWRAVQGAEVGIAWGAFEGRNALRLPCAFAEAQQRCYRDAQVRWDLARYHAFSLWVKVDPPGPVGRATMYFRSGEGWYGGWFPLARTGWQRLTFTKTDFHVEGRPTGWHSIDGLRLSFWKAQHAETAVTVASLAGHTHDVVVVLDDLALLGGPLEAAGLRRYGDLLTGWLREAGVEFGVVGGADVERGALEPAELAIFPHNPNISSAQVQAIRRFVARGGKLIVAYSMPEALAPTLGLGHGQWRRPSREGEFAQIRLRGALIDGLPARVRQNSWNCWVPQLHTARLLGTWQDADGRDEGVPAATLHQNGAYFGHVLTPPDADAKTQMLLALMAALDPGLREELPENFLRAMSRLHGLADYRATVDFIRRRAEQNARTRAVLPYLTAASEARTDSRAALAKGQLGECLEAARRVRKSLRSALAFGCRARDGEFRAVWCQSAFGVEGWSWDRAAEHLAAHGFNALFPNMLCGGRAYYPSRWLPTMPEVKERGDQMRLCLDACRRHGLQVHVWKVCWNLSGAPEPFIERMRREGRLQRSADGEKLPWLCPSDPRNFRLELESLLEVVRSYEVDGLHLDYIRYPRSDSCYCDGCRRRFEQETGHRVGRWPQQARSGELASAYRQWRCSRITRLVEAVSRRARRIRPDVQISAAVFTDYPACRDTLGQDWVSWVEKGYVDFVCPMNYTDDAGEFSHMLAQQLRLVGHRTGLYPGIGASASNLAPEDVIRQIQLARQAGAKGFVVFQYTRDFAESYLPLLGAGITAPEQR